MKLQIKYKKNRAQKLFHDDDKSPFLHLSGGYGSGKTYALVMKILRLHHLNRPYSGGLVVPSLPEFKKDILPEMEEIFYRNRIDYKYNKQDHYFKFSFSRGKLYVSSAVTRLRGPNWAYAAINEVTLIKKARYLETIARVRIKRAPYRQVASVGTPEGIGSEYYEPFVEIPMRGLNLIYATTMDNEVNLGDNYVQNMEASFDPIMLQAYRDGRFVNMQGNRFYYNYGAKHEDRTIEPPEDHEWVHFSLDFNVDPMVGTAWKVKGRELLAFDEIVLHDADTNKMVQAMIARNYTPERTVIYPDPSGNNRSTKGMSDVKILEMAGYTEIRMRKSHPGFRARQLNVNNLLAKGLLKIHPDKCKWLRKDLLAVEQDKITLEKIKDNPKLTHSSDGMDYLCDILYPLSGKKPNSSIVRIR